MSAERVGGRSSRGMASFLAVGTLGLCAVGVLSVTMLLRMDLERTSSAAEEAQALALLRAGSDAGLAAWNDGADGAGGLGGAGEVAVALPGALAERADVSLVLRAEEGAAAFWVEAWVGDTRGRQRVSLLRSGAGGGEWWVGSVALERLHAAR